MAEGALAATRLVLAKVLKSTRAFDCRMVCVCMLFLHQDGNKTCLMVIEMWVEE